MGRCRTGREPARTSKTRLGWALAGWARTGWAAAAGDRSAGGHTAGNRTAGARTAGDRTAGDRTAGDRTAADRTRGHCVGQCDGVPVVALAYLLDVTAKSPLMVYRLNMKERLRAELPPQPRQIS